MTRALRWIVPLALALPSCGRTPAAPSAPPTPSPTPAPPLQAVGVIVFYDENGNGVLDRDEQARIPDVDVDIGGRVGRTDELTGRAVVNVPAGVQTVTVRAATLPAFYSVGPPVTIQVPASADVLMAATLRIGRNHPNVYMAFGDSITRGEGSTDRRGYRQRLQDKLQAHFGQGEVTNQGGDATSSRDGVARAATALRKERSAYTLIHYGTNDWNDALCQTAVSSCFTIQSLQTIVRDVKDAGSLPVLATIIPANPSLNPPERNAWVSQVDVQIRSLAQQEGAALADVEAAFRKADDLTQLFSDHVHPNDRGYEIMAQTFFEAIARPISARSVAVFDDGGGPGIFDPGMGAQATGDGTRRPRVRSGSRSSR